MSLFEESDSARPVSGCEGSVAFKDFSVGLSGAPKFLAGVRGRCCSGIAPGCVKCRYQRTSLPKIKQNFVASKFRLSLPATLFNWMKTFSI